MNYPQPTSSDGVFLQDYYKDETIDAETVQKTFLASLDCVFATIEW